MHQSSLRTFLIIAALLLGIYMGRKDLNKPAPAFSLPEVYGGQVSLDSYRGRPVLLVFWTTSCPICQRELPLLNKLAPEFRNRGISVLAIHLGSESEAGEYLGANAAARDGRAQTNFVAGGSSPPGLRACWRPDTMSPCEQFGIKPRLQHTHLARSCRTATGNEPAYVLVIELRTHALRIDSRRSCR